MKSFLYLCLFLFVAVALQSDECDHSKGRTQNVLVPEVKFTFVPRPVTDNSAVAFLAEAGRRNFRFNGTFGLLWDCENRFKVSGEYLQQKLGYKFTTGKVHRWVRQFAIGATVEHDFCNPYVTTGEFSAYCSYAPTRHLNRVNCGSFQYSRRIAGATAYGCELGSTIKLWPYACLFIEANYDTVIYHRRFHSNRHVEGFGGSVGFHQQFFDCVGFDLRAEFRRPFNYYRTSLNWAHPQLPDLRIGIFASRTRGKSRLPCNTMVGIELNYTFSDFHCPDWGDCFCDPCYCSSELACWVSSPAVYLPEVLAIAEEKAVRICPSIISSPIPNVNLTVSGPFVVDVSPFFTSPNGSPISFAAAGLPTNATIDPTTGIISGIATSGLPPFLITIIATNSCGSVSENFLLSFCSSVPTSTTISPFATCFAGAFNYAVGGFFTNPPGTNPLVFTATGLPLFATIDPTTGTISGINPNDTNIYNVTVTARNGCGSTSQTFTMTFTCPAPTSVPIANIIFGALPGTPYSFDVVAPAFTSPCGQPFTFTMVGLAGGTINPTTGVISGLSNGGLNTVTVTGTTACGSSQQTFLIDFRSF